jgi:hypothetical protein
MQYRLDAEPEGSLSGQGQSSPKAHHEYSNIRNIMPNSHADKSVLVRLAEKEKY